MLKTRRWMHFAQEANPATRTEPLPRRDARNRPKACLGSLERITASRLHGATLLLVVTSGHELKSKV